MNWKSPKFRRNLVILILLLVAIYVILPQLHTFHASLKVLRGANRPKLALGLAASFAAYLFAAGTYYFLALKPLRYGRTLIVQLSNLLVNRIVPAGIGGLGLNYQYLRSNKHSGAQAVTVVTLNNLAGVIGNTLLLGILFVLQPMHPAEQFHLPGGHSWWLLVVLVAILLAASLKSSWRQKLRNFGIALVQNVGFYSRRPYKLVLALSSSMFLTLFNALSFWLCCQAVGIQADFLTVFIILSLGVAVGTATPTPGGLGGVEASLVAGLVAAHFASAPALAAVLIYRLLSYWLPLVVGAIAATVVTKRQYITFKAAS